MYMYLPTLFDAQVPKDHNPTATFFWNFTYRLQVSIIFVDSARFLLLRVGLLLAIYYLLASLWERRKLGRRLWME